MGRITRYAGTDLMFIRRPLVVAPRQRWWSRRREGFRQGAFLFRRDHEMDVLGREAIALYTRGKTRGSLLQVSEVGPAVRVHEEHVLAVTSL